MGNRIYKEVMEAIRKNESIAVKTVFRGEEGSIAESLTRELVPVETSVDRKGVTHAGVRYEEQEEGTAVQEPVFPQERLIILGGGHVSLALCQAAAKCDFRVYVCDDRPAFANEERFPEAEQVLCDTFENCISSLKITPYDFVVIVTRGHVHDGDCLRVILPGDEPAYTGLIGSRRRVKGLMAQLEGEGYSREKMDRICTPSASISGPSRRRRSRSPSSRS